jgi:predicted amidohydrolase
MQPIRAAAVQFTHRPGEKAANLETIERFVREAADREVGLLVFPEMCITGYWHVRKLSREQIDERYERIVGFSEIAPFIDQPIKTYSSGMIMRLAKARARTFGGS